MKVLIEVTMPFAANGEPYEDKFIESLDWLESQHGKGTWYQRELVSGDVWGYRMSMAHKTFVIGFSNPDHAVMYKLMWGGQ